MEFIIITEKCTLLQIVLKISNCFFDNVFKMKVPSILQFFMYIYNRFLLRLLINSFLFNF